MWPGWLVVCDCGFSLSALWHPLSARAVLLGFLLAWTWWVSSRLLQQSAATAPYFRLGVAPLSYCLLHCRTAAASKMCLGSGNFWAPWSPQMVTAAMKLKNSPWKKSYDQPWQHIQKQRHYFVNKGPSSQGYGFSSSHVWMWELDNKESWAAKNWCLWTVVLEKTLEGPLDFKEIQPVILKEISPEHSLEGLMLKLKLQKFAHLMWRADSLEKTLMLGNWRQEENDDRGWDGLMASPTQWRWVWAFLRS